MGSAAAIRILLFASFLSLAMASAAPSSGRADDGPSALDQLRGGPGAGAAQAVPAPADPAREVPEPPPGNTMPTGNKWGYLVLAYHVICAQLAEYGILPGGDAPGFDKLSERVLAAARNSAFEPRRAGQPSLFGEEGFVRELEALSGAAFSSGGAAEFLIDGPAAFLVKDRLVKEAKSSIHIVTYAVYDDVTGNETMDMLLAKKREGLDIKVVVDRKMAHIFGARQLKKMEQAGIGVLRYSDPRRPHNFLHVKMLIVDGRFAVVGGMNYGDVYSHKGDSLKWRDTDVLYTGGAVAGSMRIFADIWNAGTAAGGGKSVPGPAGEPLGGPARIAVLLQDPPDMSPPILLSIVKGLYGATKRVNIENAYIVAIPALTQAIADAAARGVEVNILTNSKESIDSDGKPMAEAILGSARVFAASGANVYLKKGQTLHSKFMTVDGVFCNIGSYNMHPRSERYDMELNVNILDAGSVAGLDRTFRRDLAAAEKVVVKELEPYKPGWLARIIEKYFFSQLKPGRS